MKQVTAAALLLLLLQFLLPVLLIRGTPPDREGEEQPSAVLPINRVTQTEEQGERDRDRTLTLLEEDGTVTTLNMADYLWGVVAAEMPASFQMEALKAQAAAARTYSVMKQTAGNSRHPQADLCTDSTCCQAYITREEALANWGDNGWAYAAKIGQAVAQTDGLGVVYDGQPIQAVFFSSAPGRTVDAQEVWGSAVPYLVSVDSPEGEEVPNYRAQLTLTAAEFKGLMLEQYPQADLSGAPEGWMQNLTYGPSGMVASAEVGGVRLTGGQVRKLLGLRSACFTLSVSGEQFTFQTTGYGHGVGMSQYGANAMAREGKTFQEILTWYYTGTQVALLW